MEAPKRAVTVTLKIGADTRKDLVDSLFIIAHQMEREGITSCVSGSPSSGWIIETQIDETITHDAYFQRVDAYLAEMREAEKTPVSPASGEVKP